MQYTRYPERRRTVRVSLQMPVRIEGRSADGSKVHYRALTQNLSADGALLLLDARDIAPGQPLVLTNEMTTESMKCFVASVRESRDRKQGVQRFVGVGFSIPQKNFWHIFFPKAGTRQATRSARTGGLIATDIERINLLEN
ncbi:MAG: PilZ domain-containing protein [Acidobacteriia bacterium]|nr:PilZ domain-containing protein [Terriglobia bacterium]